ncbi:MAG TPA: response regulator [Pirellulales bacterium]|jgi:two-component system response regulator TtrR
MPLSTTDKQTVFVVDDDEQMRDSLRVLLEMLGFHVNAFGTPASFLRFYRSEMRGCLLLDIRMPRQSGLELYEQLLGEGKRIPVIFITAHADVSTAVAAMKTGAIEFLEKPFERATLLERVEKALALDAEWRQSDAEFTSLAERIARLNPRDRDTLRLIEAGLTNKAMAGRLQLTERAVEMRRSAIMRKLRVRTMAELIELTATHRVLADLRRATADRVDR